MKANCHALTDTPKQIIAKDNRYTTTTYSVFPGIEFTFVDVHGHQIINEKKSKDDNSGSKFAAAFRSVKGVNPAQYRNEVHRESKTIQTEPFSVF